MIEQLRIQCPSCGIVLDVRNSKHEAIKRITCPHCKKQLAVDFQEKEQSTIEPQPIGALYYGEMRIALHEGNNQLSQPDCEYVAIRVVRLKDGNNKCLVRALHSQHPVMLNSQPLDLADEVSLTDGDELQTGKTILTYNRPGKPVEKGHLPKWMLMTATFIVAVLLVWCLWPTTPKQSSHETFVKTSIADSAVPKPTLDQPKAKPSTAMVKETKKAKQTEDKKQAETTSLPSKGRSSISDYELEQQAMRGCIDAQYELGNRLVHRSGRSNVIRGIKYLRMAAGNGSSQAHSVLTKAIGTLQQQAQHGDSIAYYILKSI